MIDYAGLCSTKLGTPIYPDAVFPAPVAMFVAQSRSGKVQLLLVSFGTVSNVEFLPCQMFLSFQMQTQCGVNVFILDSRRVLAPAPKVLGSDIKTHLKSRFCLQAILTKKGRDIKIWD